MTSTVVLSRVTPEVLSVDRCVAAVSTAQVGGIGVFVGTVRQSDHGRAVTTLAYEAHPSSEQVLSDLCSKFATDDVIAIAVEHRVGDLDIGDIAVVVAVSAAHRAEALTTTHQLIDEIKASLPIWKHQTFADGTSEWVNCL